MAFDTYVVPSPATRTLIDGCVTTITRRSSSPVYLVRRRIYQRLSFAIWCFTALAISFRNPAALTAAGYYSDGMM